MALNYSRFLIPLLFFFAQLLKVLSCQNLIDGDGNLMNPQSLFLCCENVNGWCEIHQQQTSSSSSSSYWATTRKCLFIEFDWEKPIFINQIKLLDCILWAGGDNNKLIENSSSLYFFSTDGLNHQKHLLDLKSFDKLCKLKRRAINFSWSSWFFFRNVWLTFFLTSKKLFKVCITLTCAYQIVSDLSTSD